MAEGAVAEDEKEDKPRQTVAVAVAAGTQVVPYINPQTLVHKLLPDPDLQDTYTIASLSRNLIIMQCAHYWRLYWHLHRLAKGRPSATARTVGRLG